MGHEKPSKGAAGAAGNPRPKKKQQRQVEDVEKAPIEGAVECSNFRNGFHEILFVWVVTSAQWMTQANLGNTILALRYIAEGLGIPGNDTARQTWFVASYSCTVGGFVLITGRLGDLYGHKNLFILGWAWLSISSLACCFSRSEISFNIFRGLAGIGPSILMPNAAALLAAGWGPSERWKKNAAFVAFGATAPAGYVLGAGWGAGIVQSGFRWEWIFWSVAVVAAVYSVASWTVIPDRGGMNVRREGGIDYWGSVVGVAGLVLVFVALNCGATIGWQSPKAGIMLGVGISSLAAFCWIETIVKEPILPMSLFQNPTFVAVATSICLGWMSFGMFQFYFPHFAMEFRHVPPLTATLQLLPVAPYGLAASSLAVFLLPRIPTAYIFLTSMLAFFFGQVLLALTPPDQSYWLMSFPTIFVIILGPEFSFSCGSLIASDNLAEEMQGVAGSFVNTVVNYSIALGLALAGNVERGVIAGGQSGEERLKGYRAAYWFGAACAAFGALMTLVFWKRLARRHAAAET